MSYEVSNSRDISELINHENLKIKHLLLMLSIALSGILVDGMLLASIGVGTAQLTSYFNLSSYGLAFVSASVGIGALIGAAIGGFLTDKLGRTTLFAIDMLLFVLASILAALSINAYMYTIFRAIMGMGVGIDFPVALSFVAEVSRISKKARNVSAWNAVEALGFILIYLILAAVFIVFNPGINIWRWAAGLIAIPAAIVLIMRFVYLQESPLWLASQGKVEEAVDILKNNYGLDIKYSKPSREALTVREKINQYKVIFSKKYWKRSVILGIEAPVQGIEFYAVTIFTPVILAAFFNVNFVLVMLGSAFINIFNGLGSVLTMGVVQKIGFRKVGIIGAVPTVFVLLTLGLYTNELTPFLIIALISLFEFLHAFGIGPLPMSMGSISYPTEIRGTGLGWIQTMIRVGSVAGLLYFPIVKAALKLSGTFLLLMFVPLVMILILSLFKWEPVNMDIDRTWEESDSKVH